jgi:hypothetical protein
MNCTEHPASNSASNPKPQAERVGTLGGVVTVTVHVEVLSTVFRSGVVETTVAVLTIGPAEFGLATVIVTVAEPLLAIVPREQLTAPVKEQGPCGDAADTNVVPAGRMSVTVTPAAAMGPAFAIARL